MPGKGKNQGIERERKFLVKQLPPRLSRLEHAQIEQGYLAIPQSGGAENERRIRRTGRSYVIHVKKGSSSARQEKEVPIPASSTRQLWPLTEHRRISKTRYKIPHDGLKIELDVYRGRLRGL